MIRILISIIGVMFSVLGNAQSNLVFSIPSEYDFRVMIQNFNSTKPQTWQTKFENIPAGEIRVTIVVSKSSAYQREQTFTLNIERGYELTYFILPYDNGIMCRLANYYTIEQVYGKNHLNDHGRGNSTGDEQGTSTSRVRTYKGKPVMSTTELNEFLVSVKKIYYFGDRVKFIKTHLPDFYMYTDDIVQILSLLTTENEKLDVAIYAYDYTIDNSYYFKLRGSFSQYSYDQLTDSIAKKK